MELRGLVSDIIFGVCICVCFFFLTKCTMKMEELSVEKTKIECKR
jgi:hypothetical protein